MSEDPRRLDRSSQGADTQGVAYTLDHMRLVPAEMVAEARSRAGLSYGALARRAGVPASTVARVEQGVHDPTVGMLARLLGAAGEALDLEVAPPPRTSLAALALSAWDPERGPGDEIDWTRMRLVVDEILEGRTPLQDAIVDPPCRIDPRFDALLAGLAEQLADDAGVPPPGWCKAVKPLAEPWEAPGTAKMRARARAETPPRWRARNVWFAADNLWRETVAKR